jgi:WD40-like Beta Propeller Repeat
MREAMNMMRFTLLGAVGFGIGAAIATSLVGLGTLLGGAVGGAALGLALKDFRRAVFMALLGALGLFLGVSIALMVGSYFSYPVIPTAAFVGAILGAALGLAFVDWRRVLILGVVGSVGCAIGVLAGGSLQPVAAMMGVIVFAGIIGGASLGAALGYLETVREEHRIGQIILPLVVIAVPLVAVYVLAPIVTEAQRAQEVFPTKDGEIIFASEGPPYPGTVISTINSDGTALATVPIRPGHDNTFPAFSPDGKKIAFTKWAKTDIDIFTIDASDGSQQRNLTQNFQAHAAGPPGHPTARRLRLAPRPISS